MGILKNLAEGKEDWLACKHTIKVELKFSNGKTKSLETSQVQGLYIEKDYDSDHLPIVLLDLSLSRIDENEIKNDTEFKIRIKQYYIEEEEGEKKDQKIFLNDTFVKLDFGKKPDNSTKIDKKIRDENDLDNDDVALEDLTRQITYPLIRKSDLLLTKKIINGVISNVRQLDVLAWALTKAGCRKPMLLSNFTNSASIGELIVHPKGLLENLIYWEKEYGWHREGTYLFLDFDVLYIIRMNGQCTAWRPNEPKKLTFCISDAESEDNIPTGVLVKKNTVYYNIGVDQYDVINATDISDHIEGNNMILVDTGNGVVSNIKTGVSSYGGTGSYNTKSYHGHNPYVGEQYKRRKSEQEHQIKFTCNNGDLGYLTPNKSIAILTDVTEIVKDFKGSYRLGGFKASFIKNGEHFDNTIEITVKRVSKN